MTTFQPFLLERYQSAHEQEVEINLSESGIEPLTLAELAALDPRGLAPLLDVRLGYPHVNGIPALRAAVAGLHPGAEAGNVLVTVGASEANYLVARTLLGPGDRLVAMTPNYLQVEGIARNAGVPVTPLPLDPERGWRLDRERLAAGFPPGTKLVAVCHPNNPTGRRLDEAEIAAIVAAAERAGAWILADEVYRGSERDGASTTFWGRSPRVVVTGSTSKTYGLPGLRAGWIVAPAELVEELWMRHEYVAISAATLSNHLAALALSPAVRPRLIARARERIEAGLEVLTEWGRRVAPAAAVLAPEATGVTLVRTPGQRDSLALAERLRVEHGVLVVPGAHFGLEGFLRIGFAGDPEALRAGLERIASCL